MQSLSKQKIIEGHIVQGYSYTELANIYRTTRSKIAGIIWRYRNPGMWKKGVSTNDPSRYRDPNRKH